MARDLLKHKFIKNAKKNAILLDLIERLQEKKKNKSGSAASSLQPKKKANASDEISNDGDGGADWDFGTVKPAAATSASKTDGSNKNVSNEMGTIKSANQAFQLPPAPATNPSSNPSSKAPQFSNSVKAKQGASVKTNSSSGTASFDEVDQILADAAAMSMNGGTVKAAHLASKYLDSVSSRNQNSLDILDLVIGPSIEFCQTPAAQVQAFENSRQVLLQELRNCESMSPGFSEQFVQGIIQRIDVEPSNGPPSTFN